MTLAGKTFVTATNVIEEASRPVRAAARPMRFRTSASRSGRLTVATGLLCGSGLPIAFVDWGTVGEHFCLVLALKCRLLQLAVYRGLQPVAAQIEIVLRFDLRPVDLTQRDVR